MSPAATGSAPLRLQTAGDPGFVKIWSALGNPGIVLPHNKTSNVLPVGAIVSAAHGKDHELLLQMQYIESV